MKIGIGPKVRTPETNCPKCGRLLSACSGINKIFPMPEDVTICKYCQSILIFNKDMTARLPSQVELEEIQEDKEFWSEIQSTISALVSGRN